VLSNQRGQAHLPNHELITVECQSLLERLSTRDRPSQSKSLSGREGGLAPAGWLAVKSELELDLSRTDKNVCPTGFERGNTLKSELGFVEDWDDD